MARSAPVITEHPSAEESPGIETGSFISASDAEAVRRAARSKEARSKLVVASYNIRYAVGSFLISGSLFRRAGWSRPRRRHSLVARHLQSAAQALTDGRRLPPVDIVALQEADKETLRAGGHHIARELAEALGFQYVNVTSGLPRDEEPQAKQWYLDFEEQIPQSDTGDTGIALLSGLPLLKTERVELPWSDCAWRPRLALAATVEWGQQSLSIFNSHIDPHASIEGQLEQHRAVLALAADLSGPVLLLGDFNTLSKRSCVELRRLIEAHGFTTPFANGTATWRAGLIRLHTDWIFVRGVEITRWGVARRLSVSDHWPVWVEIKLKTAASSV